MGVVMPDGDSGKAASGPSPQDANGTIVTITMASATKDRNRVVEWREWFLAMRAVAQLTYPPLSDWLVVVGSAVRCQLRQVVNRTVRPPLYNSFRAHRDGFSFAHLCALRVAELPRVVGLLRGERIRNASRARIQRHPERGRAHRHFAALQVPRQRP